MDGRLSKVRVVHFAGDCPVALWRTDQLGVGCARPLPKLSGLRAAELLRLGSNPAQPKPCGLWSCETKRVSRVPTQVGEACAAYHKGLHRVTGAVPWGCDSSWQPCATEFGSHRSHLAVAEAVAQWEVRWIVIEPLTGRQCHYLPTAPAHGLGDDYIRPAIKCI